MTKIVSAENALRKLNKNTACYVLISCSTPDKNGKMEVEMHYEGDETLAAFLVDNASQVFDDRLDRQQSK